MAGNLDEIQRVAFENHLAGCHACASRVAELDLRLRRIPSQPMPRRPRGKIAAAFLMAAAVLVLAGLAHWRWTPTRLPWRDEPFRSGRAAAELISPAKGDGEAPDALVWRAPEGESECRAELARQDLTPIWISPSTGSGRVTVPPEVRSELESGSVYLWRVICGRGAREVGTPYRQMELDPRD